jgi:putative transport protein
VDFLKMLLEQQPLMTLFLTIAVGYFVGEINIKGFSLGVGAVLFVALAAGWFAPNSAPAPMIGTLGLSLFLYTVGVQYGKQFFLGLTSAAGRRANLLALIGVLCAGAASVAIQKIMQLNPGYALGLFSGSGTSTAALQAAIATLGNDDAAVGYSVSYPFGVAGPILLLYLAFMVLAPKIKTASNAGLEILEIALRNPAFCGKTLAEAVTALPANVQIVAVRSAHHNAPATPELVLTENDVVLAVSPNESALAEARKSLGEAAPGRVLRDRGDLDYLRVFASRANVVGRMLGELKLPDGSIVAHVRRGDADVMPSPDLILEYGDRVGLLTQRAAFPALRTFFGDSIKGTAEFSYISVGLGMALGFLVGAIQIPLPGLGKLALGLCGVFDRGAYARQTAPHGGHQLDDAAARKPRVAQSRADDFSCSGGHGVGAEVRRDGLTNRTVDACPWRDRAARAGRANSNSGSAGVPAAVRRGGGHRCRCLRQSGDSRFRQQAHANRQAGHRLRDDVSGYDDREDTVRGSCGRAVVTAMGPKAIWDAGLRRDKEKGLTSIACKALISLVGARGFEPPTTRPPGVCATRLRYAPNS